MALESTTVTIGGVTYEYYVYRQHDLNNCGPSSIVMLVKQALNKDISIGFAQMLCGKMEENRGLKSAEQADSRWHSWGEGGTTIGWVLLDSLKKKWPKLNAYENPVNGETAQLKLCSPNKPAICRVEWSNNTGHFIVCLGKSGDKMVYLDPYYGIVVCSAASIHSDGSLKYSTASNSFNKGTANGHITYAIFTNPD